MTDGVSRGPLAIDWFFFNRGLFEDVPPFSIGRARFDNWLVWRARSLGAAVIDGTAVMEAFHQRHNYRHLAAAEERPIAAPTPAGTSHSGGCGATSISTAFWTPNGR